MGSLRGAELEKNVFSPVKCLQVVFQVGKCIGCMTAILGHEGKVNQRANTLQSPPEIMLLRTVRISQCGRQYGRNTAAEVAHFLSLPLCDFTIGLFRYAEPEIRWNFFPSIVERLLSFMLFEKPLYPFHHMFE